MDGQQGSRDMEKRINITTTEYEGADFPEAQHYPQYVANRIAENFQGFEINVSTGLSTSVHVYGDESIDAVELADQVKVDLWETFCATDYKQFTPKRLSINNGNTYTTAEDIEEADLERHWDVLAQAMDDDLREELHSELAPCGNREFLTAYLERAPHDLVIG